MKQMYNLRPYTVDFLVKPAKILYTLPSFHNIDGQIEEERLNGPQNNTKAEHAFSELCEQRGPPADLEEDFGESSFCGLANNSSPLMVSSDQISAGDKMESRMKDLNARLDSFILKYSSAKTANSTTKKEQKNPKKNEKASNNQKTTQEKAAKALIIETSPSKPSKNQPELVHSNVTPTAEFFPIHFYDSSESFKAHQQICCTHRKCDLKWITVFKRLQKQCSAKVNFKEGTRLQISCPAKKLELSDDIFAVWKCLGTIYGLFCSAESDSDTTQTLWLERLSTLVDSSPSKLDALSRELSRHLAQSDFICTTRAICFPDLLARAFFNNEEHGQWTSWNKISAANNVQLWVKRIDESLTHQIGPNTI